MKLDNHLKQIFPPGVRFRELGWLKKLYAEEGLLRKIILLIIVGVSLLVSAGFYLFFKSRNDGDTAKFLIYTILYAMLFLGALLSKRIEIPEGIYMIFLLASLVLNLVSPLVDNYYMVPLLIIPPAAFFFRNIREATIVSSITLVLFTVFFISSPLFPQFWGQERPELLMFIILISCFSFEASLLFVRAYLSYQERVSLFKSRIFDESTGLPKRYLIEHTVQQSHFIYIAIISIKNLSHIGIIMGYDFLTKVTVTIADMLKIYKEEYDFNLYRLTKGEFGIVLEGPDQVALEEKGKTITDRLSKEIKDYKITNNNIFIYVEIDFGAATGKAHQISEILSKADQIKIDSHNYLNTQPFIRTDIRTRYISDQKSYDVLLSNIMNETLEVHYQPIIELKSGKMIFYESLLRLRNSENRLISIYEYLDIAKRTGVYTQLTLFVMKTVFNAIQTTEGVCFSLNISLTDIENLRIREFLFEHREFLNTHNDRLILEITETEISTNSSEMTDFLKFAKEMGLKIAIDDFGTGYSNFTRLSDFPPYICKIDGKLFQKACTDNLSSKVLEGIINLCKNLSVHTVAEFIETEEQRMYASQIQVDFGQGYLFKKPGPELEN